MNRHYTTVEYEDLCTSLREKFPGATLTTDVMVGFPGETDSDFGISLDFVKKIGFEKVHVFPYSRRSGTKADQMDGQLSNQVKHDRARIMIAECEKISQEIEKEYNREEHDILVEETFDENGVTYGIGYTKEYIRKKIAIKT